MEEGVRETQSTLAEDRRSSEQVQIIDSTNQVVAWSARRLRGEPISALRPAPGKTAKEQLPRVPALGQDDEVLVSARGVEVKDQAYVVLVAEPLEVQTDTLRTVGLLLLAASPLLIALVGVAVWVLVGQSLKTVERIRRQVAEIDGQPAQRARGGAADWRRNRRAGSHDERDAGQAGALRHYASGVLLRREPRAAQPLVDAGDDRRGRESGRDRQDLARHAADRAQ